MDHPSNSVHSLIPTTKSVGFSGATYLLVALALIIAVVSHHSAPAIGVLSAAFLLGWSEVDGACGTSHVLAITPLRKLERIRFAWLGSATAYTFGGIVTAGIVGATLGLLVGPHSSISPVLMSTAVVVAIAFLGREAGILHFPIPTIARQTDKMWAMRFGLITGAAMWGAHIGIGFATVIRHGGFYALVFLALALGPELGAGILVCYWLGRTGPIWAAPIITDNKQGSKLQEAVSNGSVSYRLCHATGLAILIYHIVAIGFK